MKNVTIRQRILLSLALILSLMVAMGGTALLYFQTIRAEVLRLETDSLPGLLHSTQLMEVLLGVHVQTERHVMSNDRRKMEEIAAVLREHDAQVEKLLRSYESSVFKPRDRELFEAVQTARTNYVAEQQRALKLSADLQSGPAAALFFGVVQSHFQALQSALQALMDYNEQSSHDSLVEISASAARSRQVIALAICVAIGLAFMVGRGLFRAIDQPLGRLVTALDGLRRGDFSERMRLERRDEFGTVADGFDRMADELAALVGQIQKSGLQVTTSVTEVSATSKEQQATAKEIAATTAEIGATSLEISATSKELVKTMSEVAAVAEQSASLASSGQSGLTRMEEILRGVVDAAVSITGKLAVLSEKAGNINQVITTITKVADQTNLLSLNAAIEAEKAGDQGRGFAVVATEIRRLADQTAVATYDIEQTVKEIQSAVSASVMGMDKFSEELRRGMHDVQQIGGQLAEIIEHVQALVPRFESVNEGMQAQATGAEQISEALSQLNDAAQQTAESLRESSLAIEELKQVANGLRGGVSRFKLSAA